MRCNPQTSEGQTEQQEAKQDGHIKGCGLQYTNAASKCCMILEENWELKTNRKLDDNHEDEDNQDDEEEDDQESGRKDIEDGQARELQWKCLCPSALHTICVSLQTVFFNLPYSLYFTHFPSIWDCTDTVLANFMLFSYRCSRSVCTRSEQQCERVCTKLYCGKYFCHCARWFLCH